MRYDGTYKGIIIQNNDPNNSGRVKVFVPSVNMTILDGWNTDKESNKQFSHLGKNTNTSLTPDIIQRLKESLPWARVSMPIFGASTPGIYDNAKNISYIGNDSDTVSQQGNKSERFFAQDKAKEQTRQSTPIQGSPPRSQLNTNGLQMGNLSFPSTKCSEDKFPSIWKPTNNACLGPLIANLPTEYPNKNIDDVIPDDSIRPNPTNSQITRTRSNNEQNINRSISDIFINVVNPDIFINDKKLDMQNSVFNNICFRQSVVPTYSYQYDPPIFFEETSSPIQYPILSDIPIKLVVNNILIDEVFTLTTTPSSDIAYISVSDNPKTRIQFGKNNIQGITIQQNSAGVDISSIKNLSPFVPKKNDSAFLTILPRIASMFTMLSSGGGSACAYNRPNTKLLPAEQRKESLIGGNNPVSKENRNFGKEDSSINKSQSGSNQQSKPDTSGPYRPPDHANNFKGLVSIPAPGAHVHVRFEDGNPNYPIVIDTFADKADYENIFGVSDQQIQGPPQPVQGPPGFLGQPLSEIQGPPRFLSQPQNLNPPIVIPVVPLT